MVRHLDAPVEDVDPRVPVEPLHRDRDPAPQALLPVAVEGLVGDDAGGEDEQRGVLRLQLLLEVGTAPCFLHELLEVERRGRRFAGASGIRIAGSARRGGQDAPAPEG